MTNERDDYDIPLEGYEAALGSDLSVLQARVKELEAQISAMEEGMTAVHMAGYMDGRKAAEATLRKLEYWFDTDQEILDVMGNDEKADHMRKLKMIRDALKGGKDE